MHNVSFNNDTMAEKQSSQTLKLTTRLLPWFICSLAAIFYCYEYYLRIAPGVMSVELIKYFNISGVAFGSLSAFYYFAYAPMQLPVGVLLDRYGCRALLTIACTICVLGSFIFATAYSYNLAIFGRFLVGFGSAFAFVGVLKLAIIWLPKNHFALFAGLASALGTLGAMSGEIHLTKLVEAIGWRETLLLSSIVGCILALALLFGIRDYNKSRSHRVISTISVIGSDSFTTEHVSFKRLVRDLISILSKPQMWLVGLIGCLLYLPTSAFAELWASPFLRSVYGYSNHHAGFAVSFIFIGFTIGSPLAGYISDKIRSRRLPLLVGGFLATLIFFALLTFKNLTPDLMYTLMFMLGMSYGVQAIVFAIGTELCDQKYSGTAIAVVNMFVMIGGMLFQPIVGKLLDYGWNGQTFMGARLFSDFDYRMALMSLPGCMLIAVIITFYLGETHPERAQPSGIAHKSQTAAFQQQPAFDDSLHGIALDQRLVNE